MSDPTRFTDDHPSKLARSLLAAGLDDEPSPALLERTLAPLGLGVAVAAAAETARAATTGATALATSTAPAAATTAFTSSLFVTTVKWVGIAGIGGGLVVGATATLSPSSEPPTASRTKTHASTAPVVAAPVRATPPTPAAPSEPPRDEPPSEPAAPEQKATATPPPAPGRAARASADAEATKRSALLAEEAKVIDEARDAVATGDSARALRALRAHRATFDKPLLKPEALFLEMRALAAQGNAQAATRVAEELLRRYPKGPQAAAARSFLRTTEP